MRWRRRSTTATPSRPRVSLEVTTFILSKIDDTRANRFLKIALFEHVDGIVSSGKHPRLLDQRFMCSNLGSATGNV